MEALAIVAPIRPDKIAEWKEWSDNLDHGPQHKEYAAFCKKAGVDRVRVWLQEGPQGPLTIVLYEGKTPEEFLSQLATAQGEFAQWFRGKLQETHGFDPAKAAVAVPKLIGDIKV